MASTTTKATTFAARLADLIDEHRLSVPELATRTSLSGAAIRYLLAGKRQPNWETVQKLADAMRISTEAFR